jgi:hypothetical protein
MSVKGKDRLKSCADAPVAGFQLIIKVDMRG